MNPVLFLDFDGPMFPDNGIALSAPMSEYPGVRKLHPLISYWEMSKTSVRQLNALYNIYQFDTVISSSWKHFVDYDDVIDLFKANGLDLHLHQEWRTPDKFSSYRINEICWWLDNHTKKVGDDRICPAHIILDDPWSGSYLDEYKSHGVAQPYMIDPNVGIDPEVFKFMKSDVISWRDDPLSRKFKRVFPRRDWNGIVD